MNTYENKIIYNHNSGEIKIGNKTIKLSRSENEIMLILVENKSKFVSREKITEALYGENWRLCDINNIGIFICRLRKKLEGIMLIRNRVGYGYCIEKIDSKYQEMQGEEIYNL